jgi:hypothetical protein
MDQSMPDDPGANPGVIGIVMLIVRTLAFAASDHLPVHTDIRKMSGAGPGPCAGRRHAEHPSAQFSSGRTRRSVNAPEMCTGLQ